MTAKRQQRKEDVAAGVGWSSAWGVAGSCVSTTASRVATVTRLKKESGFFAK